MSADTEYQLLIDGEWVAAGGGTYPIVNPATEEVVGHAPNASAADAEAAAAAAAEAFGSWSRTSPEERIAVLERALVEYKARAADMAEAISLEMGAPISPAAIEYWNTAATRTPVPVL